MMHIKFLGLNFYIILGDLVREVDPELPWIGTKWNDGWSTNSEEIRKCGSE